MNDVFIPRLQLSILPKVVLRSKERGREMLWGKMRQIETSMTNYSLFSRYCHAGDGFVHAFQ